MDHYKILCKLNEFGKSKYGERVLAELAYLKEIPACNNAQNNRLLTHAMEFLYERAKADGVITNESGKACEDMLLSLSDIAKGYKLHCVAHAHIDMNWMWGQQETISITIETFKTMLKLMREYPEFTFSQSQASTYKIVEEYDPDVLEQIKQRVQEGRWEVTASTWVEADKNMPNGESMCRHILYAKRYLTKIFGLKPDQLLLDFEPDTFGHCGCIPEVLNHGGVKYYYQCRGNDRENVYNWVTSSGSRVLVYRDPLWYNMSVNPKLLSAIPSFCSRYGIQSMLYVYGVGDHGGGPTRKDIELLRDIQKWPLAPTVEFSSYIRFFRELELSLEKFPVYEGEQNFVFTGCYSSQSRIKMSNRISEDRLYTAEAITALSVLGAEGKKYSGYAKAWENVLFNQFHDILPGSGVLETREYAMGAFQQAMGYVNAGMAKALDEIASAIDTSLLEACGEDEGLSTAEGAGVGYPGGGNGFGNNSANRAGGMTRIFHIFNTVAHERRQPTEIVVWDWMGRLELLEVFDAERNKLTAQILETGEYWAHRFIRLLIEATVPATGYGTVILREACADYFRNPFNSYEIIESYQQNRLENERICAVFDPVDMCLVSLTDKATGKELITQKSCYYELVEQSTRLGSFWPGNAWVEGVTTRTGNLNQSEKVHIVNRAYGKALRQSIKYEISYRDSKIETVVSLDKDSTVLKFDVVCDWQEIGTMESDIPALRFQVPLSYQATSYLYETPFGIIQREDTNHDVPARNIAYAVNDEDDLGVVVMSDTLYGYRGENNGISVTLLRSSHAPDKYPELGSHHFALAISACDKRISGLSELAGEFIYPMPFVTNTVHGGYLPLVNGYVKKSENIAISAIKVAEDDDNAIIIRAYEIMNTGGDAFVELTCPSTVSCVDINELPCDKVLHTVNRAIQFNIKPREIVTLKFTKEQIKIIEPIGVRNDNG